MSRPGGARSVRIAQESFEAIAESIPHIVWLAAPDGATDYFNDRGTAYTGFARQANYGWRWVSLVHPDDAARARLGWEHATRTVTPYELSFRIRRSDGEYRWHACRALPVRGSDGEILKWIGTADDVEDRSPWQDDFARVERQTRELRSLLNTVGPAGVDHPPVAGRAAQVRRVNEALRERPPDPVAPAVPGPSTLAPRDLEVLRLVAQGHTSTEIANVLGWSLRTIELARARLRQRLGLRSRADFVRYASDAGLLDRRA